MWIEPKTDWNGSSGEYFNIEDWNRIETDIQFLAKCYGVTLSSFTWTHAMLPSMLRINDIKNKINVLCGKSGLPPIRINESLKQIFDYSSMNEIENKLLSIYDDSQKKVFSIRRSGNCICGQSIFIPGVL